MKSAYELAMERLEKQQPAQTLTPEQKARIAEVESRCNAKLAERKVFLEDQIRKALGTREEADLRKQLASEIARIEEEREEKKARIRAGKEP